MNTYTPNYKEDFSYLLEKVENNRELKEYFSVLDMAEKNLFLYYTATNGDIKAIGEEFKMKTNSITMKLRYIKRKLQKNNLDKNALLETF